MKVSSAFLSRHHITTYRPSFVHEQRRHESRSKTVCPQKSTSSCIPTRKFSTLIGPQRHTSSFSFQVPRRSDNTSLLFSCARRCYSIVHKDSTQEVKEEEKRTWKVPSSKISIASFNTS